MYVEWVSIGQAQLWCKLEIFLAAIIMDAFFFKWVKMLYIYIYIDIYIYIYVCVCVCVGVCVCVCVYTHTNIQKLFFKDVAYAHQDCIVQWKYSKEFNTMKYDYN